MSAAREFDHAYSGLIADLGGTNARLALVDRSGRVHARRAYRAAEFTSVEAVLGRYREDAAVPGFPSAAVLGVAGQVADGRARFTNLDWEVDAPALRETFGFRTLELINDFVAQALAVPELADQDLRPLGPPRSRQPGVVAVIGAGTGFGAAVLVPGRDGDIPIASEAGHTGFAPTDEVELDLWRGLKARHGRVSIERVLSGPGLVAIYERFCEASGARPAATQPAQVVAAAGEGNAAACEALERFVRIYGQVAGDLALTFGASGGVYLSGGIAPKIYEWLNTGAFRTAFEGKGRLTAYLQNTPTFLVTHPDPGLLGAARRLRQLQTADATSGANGAASRVRPVPRRPSAPTRACRSQSRPEGRFSPP
ncbi:MAG: glucokinase [Phenylobacterium sp. RIFCSPHIGHO2_01_FULL_69_31]|uniref:glucokinase n=1 Tax=Phenylobacterium sp. RIFCSPHIGHO2_01_FULL_69_31 TaxID=1801944 RepID=UPI0008C8CA43|nr:glucokinase [Phenylobacterium sp. RIFCSPHIGHO2_01_FULL_69_31]OHB29405.1 MAG: glucokinase [Phenylobacterium sp. RIFCSPHIGHO2_01_FULL_69_31]